MKYLFLSFFFTLTAHSQELDSLDFNTISQQIINNYLQDNYLDDDNVIQNGDCVYGKQEGFTLSCVYSYYNVDWTTDFDGDKIPDVLIRMTDEGLGGGGNGFGYDFTIVTLDKNKKIKETYSFFGGGKFSYGLLAIDAVKNGRVYATYHQNPAAYGYEEISEEDADQRSMEFYIENNELKEKSYDKCPLAEMNKQIFIENTGFEVRRILSLDDSYNDEQVENLYLKDKTYYYASLAGCEDIELYFTHTIAYKSSLEKNKSEIKNTWIEHALFLKETTRFKTILNEVHVALTKLDSKKLIIGEYGGSTFELSLNNNWKCYLFVSGNDEQGSFVTIRFVKLSKAKPMDFWESIVSKSNL